MPMRRMMWRVVRGMWVIVIVVSWFHRNVWLYFCFHQNLSLERGRALRTLALSLRIIDSGLPLLAHLLKNKTCHQLDKGIFFRPLPFCKYAVCRSTFSPKALQAPVR